MAVNEHSIKLVKASVMLDVPEGGGQPSANVIIDGASNAIFDDISELARAGGNVSLRKAHVTVQTTDTDGFYGANVIIAKPPEDPRVGVTLFSTGSTFDLRTDAANRVEAYLFSGPELGGYLYENHILGQRTIQLFQRPNTPVPPVGRTLVLVMNEGLNNEYRQYIRLINVEAEERTFTVDESGKHVDYTAWIVSCELSDTLRYDFPGSPASRYFKRDTGKSLARDTRVTDAARYYGVAPLKNALTLGSLKAKVKTIFTPLVPSAQTEIPLANQMLNPEVSPMIQTGAAVTVTMNTPSGGTVTAWAPTGITPGSISNSYGMSDDGLGNLIRSDAKVGTVDYALGKLVADFGYIGVGSLTYKPAVRVAQQVSTLFREVTAESRRYNWIETLQPIPAPGTLTFSYMAQGNWYSLTDNGKGELRGEDSAYGAGTINYVTGNMTVTTGVLPDADTAIMLVWATGAHYSQRTAADIEVPSWSYKLQQTSGYYVDKGSVTIQWQVGGVTKTLTDDNGFLQGNGWGGIQYASGGLYFVMETLPDPGTTPQVAYTKRALHEEEFHPTTGGNGFIELTVEHAPIVPGSLVIGWETLRSKTVSEKASNSIGGASYYSSDTEYSGLESANSSNSWQKPSSPNYWTYWYYGYNFSGSYSNYYGYRKPSAQGVGGSSSSSSLSVFTKDSIRKSSSYRMQTESESSTSESNVVVQKIAFDNGSGMIYGPQAGSVNYDTGAVRFIPTDVVRTASWGLTSSGSFKTDQSSSSSTQTDASWAGSNSYQSTYSGGGVDGSQSSSGVTTSNGSSVSASSGGESDASAGSWGSESFSDQWGSGSLVKVSYVEAAIAPLDESETLAAQNIKFNLSPMTAQQIVPGSVMFTFGGATYVDRAGKMVMNPSTSTGAGTDAGTINYATGDVELTYWIAGQQPTLTVQSCLTRYGNFTVTSAAFRTAAAPLKPEALQVIATTINGEQIIGTANSEGWILHEKMIAKVNYTSGIVLLAFGSFGPQPDWTGGGTAPTVWRALPIDASTIRYNAVAYSYLPLDAGILGLDPVRLPHDGLVPMFRKGEFVVIGNTRETAPVTAYAGLTVDTGQVRLSRVRVVGNDGGTRTSGYTHDLDAGTVTFNDVAGYSQPVKVEYRIEDMAMVSDVQINGELSFTRAITHNYPADTSYVSSALVAGDLRARVSVFFDQATWNGAWVDTLVGQASTSSYNNVVYPLIVTNAGAVSERWVIRFTNTTSFEVIGEHIGIISQGTVSQDCSPINPVTGVAYFTIKALGWGSGWSPGNVLRFNTVGAQFPIWVVRTVQQGPETITDDSFTLLVRGDVDAA